MSERDETTEDRPDGFRPRRKRKPGWYEKAIASGEVRDPDAPDPDAGKDYSGAVVVAPPVAEAHVEGKEA
jgi:hypothetical protein